MTDRMAALSALSLCDVPERGEALEDFYGRYQGDPLIIDKWFSLQAVIPEPGTLDRVKALTGHGASRSQSTACGRSFLPCAETTRNSTAPTGPARLSPIPFWRSIPKTAAHRPPARRQELAF
jgi:hypothetical protein